MAEFREKLRYLMDRKGLTIEQLGERRIGVKFTTISRWLSPTKPRRPNLDQMEMVARHFGVPLEYLRDDGVPVEEGIADRIAEEARAADAERSLVEKGRRLGVERATYLLETVLILGYETSVARLVGLQPLPGPAPGGPAGGGEVGGQHGVRVVGGHRNGGGVPPADGGVPERLPPKRKQ